MKSNFRLEVIRVNWTKYFRFISMGPHYSISLAPAYVYSYIWLAVTTHYSFFYESELGVIELIILFLTASVAIKVWFKRISLCISDYIFYHQTLFQVWFQSIQEIPKVHKIKQEIKKRVYSCVCYANESCLISINWLQFP